jgi:hypothetical protein
VNQEQPDPENLGYGRVRIFLARSELRSEKRHQTRPIKSDTIVIRKKQVLMTKAVRQSQKKSSKTKATPNPRQQSLGEKTS